MMKKWQINCKILIWLVIKRLHWKNDMCFALCPYETNISSLNINFHWPNNSTFGTLEASITTPCLFIHALSLSICQPDMLSQIAHPSYSMLIIPRNQWSSCKKKRRRSVKTSSYTNLKKWAAVWSHSLQDKQQGHSVFWPARLALSRLDKAVERPASFSFEAGAIFLALQWSYFGAHQNYMNKVRNWN